MNPFHSTYLFYRDGFRSMTLGRTLWKVILVKLFVMFGILKLFFFQDFLAINFETDEQRAAHVLNELTPETIQHNSFQED